MWKDQQRFARGTALMKRTWSNLRALRPQRRVIPGERLPVREHVTCSYVLCV
jgi:hypothetical protein